VNFQRWINHALYSTPKRNIPAMSFAFLKRAITSLTSTGQRYDALPLTDKTSVRNSCEYNRSSSSSAEPNAPVAEANFKIDARVISDAILGLYDGLTVPFALTAGLSAVGDTNIVIYGGLAELTAGAISMGLGGYLGAKSEE